MRKLASALAVVATSLLSGCVVHINGGDFNGPTHHYSQNLTLPTDGLKQLSIDNGYGYLAIEGVAGLNQIEVQAQVYTYDETEDPKIIKLFKNGSTAELDSDPNSGIYLGRSPRIDLTVRMPDHLQLTVDDGSGDITINNINNKVVIDDGSGGIAVSRIGKDLVIDDNSGDLTVSHVQGNVTIKDGSGGIEIDKLSSDLRIDDNSGDIRINHVQGNIEISDGSGGMRISHVTGKVSIDDGSGDIDISNVDSLVSINDGSGDIDVDTVKGLDIIESGSGDLTVNNVNGFSAR